MKNKTYKFYCDPGHGWLAVKRADLDTLGIAHKITHFSFERGQTVYLEEDCDVATFFKAYEAKFGYAPKNVEGGHTNNSSPIRSYPRFQAPPAPEPEPVEPTNPEQMEMF
jgi:hypothetical protein